VADACFRGGARLLQLRDKTASGAVRLALAEAVVRRGREVGAQIIINDRADIARLASADGVHVGQDDLSVDDVRLLVGAQAIVGLSTHTDAQVTAALRTTATYLAVGPIFGTVTKDTGYSARGLDLVRRAVQGGRPVVAIGGITLDRAPEVLAAGASSVAVISDLLEGDPEQRVRRYLQLLRF
jgi:thiamine-phosphate pyrophosphorylase